jgi:hypothetical protein
MKASDGSFDDPDFQRAFVAVRYVAGTRGAALVSAFAVPCEAALELERAFAAETRTERAQTLAKELAAIARRLEARRLS